MLTFTFGSSGRQRSRLAKRVQRGVVVLAQRGLDGHLEALFEGLHRERRPRRGRLEGQLGERRVCAPVRRALVLQPRALQQQRLTGARERAGAGFARECLALHQHVARHGQAAKGSHAFPEAIPGGPGLALDHDDLSGQRPAHVQHHRVVAQRSELQIVRHAEGRVPAHRLRQVLGHQLAQLLERDGLLQHLHARVRRDLRAVGLHVRRHEHHVRLEAPGAQLAQQLDPRAVGEIDVRDDHRRRPDLDVRQRGGHRGRAHHLDAGQPAQAASPRTCRSIGSSSTTRTRAALVASSLRVTRRAPGTRRRGDRRRTRGARTTR